MRDAEPIPVGASVRNIGPAGLLSLLLIVVVLPTAALTWRDAVSVLPADMWWDALTATDLGDPAQLLFRHSFVPRIAVALLAGAGLAMSGTILQQALRNPLAEPATLGTAAGASLALTFATLFAPWLLESGREGVALAGAALATLATFALASGASLNPVRLVLAGLVVTLVAGSAAATLMSLESDYITALYVWQSGSLVQNGDGAARRLFWQLLAGFAVIPFLLRPLTILALGDQANRSLGLPPGVVRFIVVSIAVLLAGCVTAATGVIAFIGLAAPALVRLVGLHSLKARLIAAPITGAALLWLTDRVVAALSGAIETPTGTATALFGAPLLLLLLPLVRAALPSAERAAPIQRQPGLGLSATLVVGTLAIFVVAVFFGKSPTGWAWLARSDWADILPLRLPRVLAAAAAGMLLAQAGVLLQRLSGNPMASPELLGVTGGAVLGVVALMVLLPGDLAPGAVLVAACSGAVVAVLAILSVSARRSQAPERLLLSGFAVATLASSLAALVLASGDPRAQWLQLWLSGSTYRATMTGSLWALAAAIAMTVFLPFTARWLRILPLGGAAAGALGLPVTAARSILVALAAIATTIATLLIGPLSFTGLMAPHLARLMGFRNPTPHLLASAAIGAAALLCADWLGRSIIYPWQVPAGLLAVLITAPAFVWCLRRNG